MPTYCHQCENPECNHEWEDDYSIKVDPPKECPLCHQQTAKRVISLGGKGVVELTGQDLVNKTKEDIQKLKAEMKTNTKLYANMLGEEKYHNLQTRLDRQKRNR
jgi:putative FmdB family regulatory protein